jgi:hypothetical protein
MNAVKTVEFSLRDGQIVTLDMSDRLVKQIVSAFSLRGPEEISENHVKSYLASGMKKALEVM